MGENNTSWGGGFCARARSAEGVERKKGKEKKIGATTLQQRNRVGWEGYLVFKKA